jgi:hypothetical protein
MPNRSDSIRILEEKYALRKLKEVFELCERTPAIQEMIEATATLELSYQNGNENVNVNELVNTLLRIKMLELEKSTRDVNTLAILLINLLLLSDYWPLNNSRVEADGIRYYICPLTRDKISGDRIFLRSGFQLDNEFFSDFFISAYYDHVASISDFRDPVTRAPINYNEIQYMLGKFPELGQKVLALDKYQELKQQSSKAYAKKLGGRTLLIYSLVTTVINLVVTFTVPAAIIVILGPILSIALLIGLPLAVFVAVKWAKAKWDSVTAENEFILIDPKNAVFNNCLQQLQYEINQSATLAFAQNNNAASPTSVTVTNSPNLPANTTAGIHQQLQITIRAASPAAEERHSPQDSIIHEPQSSINAIASVTEKGDESYISSCRYSH